ncbi:MAG: hypothetical protein HOH19_12205 [Kordiimonadaceae bacterium]|jgi:hypothetical protein|nr:hypothetical protein [Kordiimonadaceae bacterium]MBT6033332.1 hypothetical protein [Kordiimonadaceae bacterium]
MKNLPTLTPLIIYLFSSCIFVETALALSATTLPYSLILDATEHLILGKISNRYNVTYESNGKKHVCTEVYEISALKNWKGKQENFTVRIFNTKLILDRDIEYLFFIRENKNYKSNKMETVQCDGSGMEFKVPATEFYIPDSQQMIFPIDDMEEKKIHEKWMVLRNLIGNVQAIYPEGARVKSGTSEHFPSNYKIINLNDFIDVILREAEQWRQKINDINGVR